MIGITAIRAALADLLTDCRERLARDEDVSPLAVGRIEGMLMALLSAGETGETLAQWCEAQLPATAKLRLQPQVRLEFRQARAPVVPTAS